MARQKALFSSGCAAMPDVLPHSARRAGPKNPPPVLPDESSAFPKNNPLSENQK
jgi:hypothetical protein